MGPVFWIQPSKRQKHNAQSNKIVFELSDTSNTNKHNRVRHQTHRTLRHIVFGTVGVRSQNLCAWIPVRISVCTIRSFVEDLETQSLFVANYLIPHSRDWNLALHKNLHGTSDEHSAILIQAVAGRSAAPHALLHVRGQAAVGPGQVPGSLDTYGL